MNKIDPIRVLIAEDSPSSRRLLCEIVASDPDLVVVGTADSGEQAVTRVRELAPDLVSMDIVMPGMDGLEATRRIMEQNPCPVVVVSGQVESSEALMAVEALRAGALAVLPKPPGPMHREFERWRREIVTTFKSMAQVKVVRLRRSGSAVRVPLGAPQGGAKVLALACSTGGPAALHAVFAQLPAEFPLPILVVQHIAAGFVGALATSLDRVSQLSVKLAVNGESLRPGTVYLPPDDCHLGVERVAISLSDDPPIGRFRPAATHLFQSVARAFGPGVVAAILTGMGDDGVVGLHDVRRANGWIIAQDEDSCVVFGMPKAAIEAGLVDHISSLESLPSYLIERVSHVTR